MLWLETRSAIGRIALPGRQIEARHRRNFRIALLTCVSASVMSAASMALAQVETSADEEVAIEEIIITGSRIARAGIDTLQPAMAIDSSFIDERGFDNVADALNELPVFGLGVSPSGGQQPQSTGQQFVNLFGLGTQRTLTLINGRRVVAQNTPGLGSGADSGLQVDLNIIPTALVDRIETIFIGGAPIYGSDAIAGTVNIILKEDFEGFSADGQYGVDQRTDIERGRVRGVWGANIADGRGNVTLSGEYTTNSELTSRENEIARRGTEQCENPAAGIGANGLPIVDPNDGIPDLVLCDDANNIWQVPNSGIPLLPGAFLVSATGAGALQDEQGNPLVFDADGNLITFEQANLGTPRSIFFARGGDGFNNPLVFALDDRNPLVASVDRWIMMGNAHYDITDNVRIIFESLFSRTEAEGRPRDVPPFSTNVFAPGAEDAINININDNSFVSQQLRDTLILNGAFDPNLNEDQFFQVTRSNIDIVEGNKDKREQNVLRFVAGFEGEQSFLRRTWNWDAAFNYGETNSLVRQPEINGPRYALALDAVTDPNTGEIVCRAQIDPPESLFGNVFDTPVRSAIEDCIPFNPFGLQELTPEQRQYLIQEDFQSSEIRQWTVEANVNGELLDLPAGPVAVAAGFIHRFERAEFNVDRSTQIGIDPSLAIRNVSGEFDTNEVYGEVLVPIIRNSTGPGFDVPFIDTFELEGALRWVDNSIAGEDLTWTAGGRLQPDLPLIGTSLTVRGNFTRSIRSPSVQELFLPRSSVDVFASDPCDPRFLDSGPNPAVRRANCEAQVQTLKDQGTLPQNFTLDNFVSLIVNRTEPGFTGGNPDLNNEVADSWTVGGIFSPEFLPGLTLSVDWVSIFIGNEITQLSPTQILNGCFDSVNFPDVAVCDRFRRDSEFQVRNPESGFLNAAGRDFSGLVSTVSYQFAGEDLYEAIPGSFALTGRFFHISNHTREVTGGALDVLGGELGFEKLNFQLNLNYNLGRFGFLWQTLWFGSFLFDAQADEERFAQPKVPAAQIYNATFTYQLTDTIGLRAVINNVTDNRDGRLRAAANQGNDFLFRDVVGRRFLLGVNADF